MRMGSPRIALDELITSDEQRFPWYVGHQVDTGVAPRRRGKREHAAKG